MKLAILTLSLIATSASAHDGLGNHMTNQLQTEQTTAVKVLQKRSTYNNYNITTTTESNSTVINEYTDNNGRIFAITWNGPVVPNLEQLLGTYFSEYKNHKNAVSHNSHSNLVVSNGDLVVQSKGHLRAFFGIAYLKSAVPSGVDINELQ